MFFVEARSIDLARIRAECYANCVKSLSARDTFVLNDFLKSGFIGGRTAV